MLDPLLKGCPGEGPAACGFDLNADGSMVVGMTANCDAHLGFSWNRKTGLVQLDSPRGSEGEGLAVSADGSRIVGFTDQPHSGEPCPTLWKKDASPEYPLGPPPWARP